MKKILFSILSSCILTITGCVINPTPDYPYDPSIYALDSNIFFRIQFNGDTLKTYGIKSLFLPTNGPILRGSYYVKINRTTDNLGNPMNNIDMSCMGNLGNQVIAGTYLPRNQCNFTAGAMKSGPSQGNYYFTVNPQLTDLTDSLYHSYPVDMNSGYNFEITRVDSLYVGGHFNFFLIGRDGVSRMPASGSFQLNNLY